MNHLEIVEAQWWNTISSNGINFYVLKLERFYGRAKKGKAETLMCGQTSGQWFSKNLKTNDRNINLK